VIRPDIVRADATEGGSARGRRPAHLRQHGKDSAVVVTRVYVARTCSLRFSEGRWSAGRTRRYRASPTARARDLSVGRRRAGRTQSRGWPPDGALWPASSRRCSTTIWTGTGSPVTQKLSCSAPRERQDALLGLVSDESRTVLRQRPVRRQRRRVGRRARRLLIGGERGAATIRGAGQLCRTAPSRHRARRSGATMMRPPSDLGADRRWAR
jgi:hypothetical protein